MRTILFVLLIAALIIPFASAEYEITAEPLGGGTLILIPGNPTNLTQDYTATGEAVQRISIDIPTGTTVDYTLWYGNGSTVSGYMKYEPAVVGTCGYTGPIANPCQLSEVSLGGDTSSVNYVGLQEVGRIDIIGYAKDKSTTPYTQGFLVYDSTYGYHSSGDAMAFYAAQGVIYKYSLSSNKPLTGIALYVAPRDKVEKAAITSILDAIDEYVQFARKITEFVMDFMESMLRWTIFFFNNLDLIIASYMTATMAFAARNSRGNLEKFFRQWISDQVALVRFLIEIVYALVNIPATIRRIFP